MIKNYCLLSCAKNLDNFSLAGSSVCGASHCAALLYICGDRDANVWKDKAKGR